jgi:hypothetical protein
MQEFTPGSADATPTIEVVVYQRGEEIHRELCESEEAASGVVDQWNELDGVECAVDDLSVRHTPTDILDPAPDEPLEDEYRVEEPGASGTADSY